MDKYNSYVDQDDREHLSNYDDGDIQREGLRLGVERDLPLLLATRNATFVSHDQLFQLMIDAKLERDRRCFNWRLRRLIRGAYIRKLPPIAPYNGVVYSITRFGLATLESYGEGLVNVTSGSRNLPSVLQAPHFLELNKIQQAFKRSGDLKSWKSDRELISLNYVIGSPLAKDYDAVAEIKVAEDTLKIAIEYERTLKSADRYKEIQRAIRDEGQIDMVLYLTSTLDLVFTLSRAFNHPALPMCFASSAKLRSNLLETMLLFAYGSMRETLSLREAMMTIAPLKG
ncbi:MAG TPA: hypothetical protein VMU57_10700 [Edaphobacter sp.]|uniref:hypothetical protein n=1 Tax=Edaphobacter sp. TaxID=1934404 RepID=UPI002D0A0D29|nr:hypothetical protein [Edaphobacter sp.]HUZ95372.1 hypothetical protein [Edaphobacter sp.]